MKKEEETQKNNEELESEDLTFVESTEDGEVLQTKDIVKKIREELKNCRKEKEEYLTGWQRAKADYINLQKEYNNLHSSSSILTKESFLMNLLPAIDSFDMAFANKEAWEKVDKNWRMGVEYIYQQLLNGLSLEGIEKIGKEGENFNPLIHESIESIETNVSEKDHKIAKIIQTGYKIGDKIIRPARVNVYQIK